MIPRAIALLSLFATGPTFAESHDPFAATGDADAGARSLRAAMRSLPRRRQ